ncbi:MAG: protein kinase [Gemmataceae bacterium]|nr:protein kinase [Gemmataceae bacterium]
MTSPTAPSQFDGFVAAFEAACARDGQADLADFLPGRTHPLYANVLRELVRVDLELRWERREPRALADYRARFPELFADRSVLGAIAFEEYRLRRAAGQDPNPLEYEAELGVSVAGWPPRRSPGDLDDLAALSKQLPGGAEQAQLVQDVQRADPGAAQRLAEGLLNLPEVGDAFLGFRLVAELGQGAFGRVFLARQPALADRLVALKVAPDVGGESQTLAQLQHTHIVPIHSVHSAGPLQAVCMPFFGRTTLADVLHDLANRRTLPQSGPELFSTLAAPRAADSDTSLLAQLPPTAVVANGAAEGPVTVTVAGERRPGPGRAAVATQHLEGRSYVEAVVWLGRCLADGLAHAHDRGILHRDLKPANVLLTDEGQPMLLDFNLAEDTKVRGQASAALIGGTLPYMAPEHLEAFRDGSKRPDARCDLYSLGVILFQLLTGQHPFPNRRHAGPPALMAVLLGQMIRDRQQGPPSPRRLNRAVSPAVEAIIRRCLEPDPARRYASARQLQEDLQRQLDHLPLRHTREPSLRERTSKWLHHHPRLLFKVAGLAALTLFAAALWLGLRASQFAQSEEALLTLDGFRTDARAASTTLNTRGEDAAERAKAVTLGRQALARYRVLDDPAWQGAPLRAALPAEERQKVLEEIGEALLLLAGARVWPGVLEGKGEADRRAELTEALLLNERAKSCYPASSVPPAVWLQRAELHRRLGNTSEAQASRGRASGVAPRSAQDHYLLAREHTAAGQHREAMPLLEQAVRLDPRHLWAWFLLGECCDETGEDARAVNCYSVCIALAPEQPWHPFNRGLAHLRLKDPEQARADFDRVIALKPDLADAYVNRALASQGLKGAGRKEYEVAVEDLTRALERDPQATRIYFMRARARERAGDAGGARLDRAEGLRREPNDEKGWIARGVARLASDPAGALADFERALAINPRSRAALQNKAHVLAERLKRDADAVAVLDVAVALYPDHVPARIGRAVLHARLGRREEAVKDARASLARSTRPNYVYQAACVYALTSQTHPADQAPALQLLAQALRGGFGGTLLARDTDLDPLRRLPEFQRLASAVAALQAPTGVRGGP